VYIAYRDTYKYFEYNNYIYFYQDGIDIVLQYLQSQLPIGILIDWIEDNPNQLKTEPAIAQQTVESLRRIHKDNLMELYAKST
jgi:hypothetical protein